MAITTNQLVYRYPQVRSDASSNGGRMTASVIPDTKNAVFPDVPEAERTAGSNKYRKIFIHVASSENLDLIGAKVFLETYTPGGDRVVLFEGTQTDTQAAITGSERKYGCGQLDANVTAGGSTIDVLTEHAATDMFQDGDLIRISDKATVSSGTGNEQYVVINGVPSYSGDVATITLTDVLAHNFVAASTRVASVIELGDVGTSYNTFSVSSGASGTYDDTTYPIVVPNVGAVQQTWTLSFTSATAFNIIGDTLGTIGTGNVSSNTQPNNTALSSPYFILNYLGFGGTYQSGDSVSFVTVPAAIPIWCNRVVPAGTGSLSNNNFVVAIAGESE